MEQSVRPDTKAALMAAAERLIAEQGLGSVSVKMITKAAGARNPSAVHYHFGSVESLIKQVFAQRFHKIEGDRRERMAQVTESDPKLRLVALLKAAVGPFLESCLEEDGRLFASFCLQFAADPRFSFNELLTAQGTKSFEILRGKLIDCLDHVPAAVLTIRLRQGFMISLAQAADFSTMVEQGTALPIEDTIAEAASCLAAYLAAPSR